MSFQKIKKPLYATVLIAFLGFISTTSVLAADVNVCSQNEKISVSGLTDFSLDSDELTRSENAMQWIYSMMEPLGSEENGAHIIFDNSYNENYTGEITGNFTLDTPANYPVISPTPLIVSNPDPLLDTYRFVVNGTASDIATAGTHEVRAYLYTDAEYEQPAVIPADVGFDGTWSLDLSPIPVNFAGAWHFRLYEKSTNIQVGESWPKDPILQNLEIKLYSVTDAEYLTTTLRAKPGNQFSFDPTLFGTKRVKIIDTLGTTSTVGDIILDSYTNGNGVVRSYELFPGDTGYGTSFQERGYVYDQALALSAALVMDDSGKSEELVNGLLMFQENAGLSKGAFVFSAPQPSPSSRDAVLRVGAHSIALYSLLQFIDENPNHPQKQTYEESAKDALDYLEAMKSTTGPQQGLYLGGSGRYVNDVFEDTAILWASTEHNLDTWHAFRRAAKVFPNEGYDIKAKDLENIILSKLWNPNTQRFYQGYGPTAPDSADALDTNSWGSIFLSAINEDSKSKTSLERLDIYYLDNQGLIPSGWGPYSSAGGYAGATPTVWYEGSFGVLMSYAHNGLGSLYKDTLDDLKVGQLTSGAFQYATIPDPSYEIITAASIASSSWYILSTIGIEDFWSECFVPEITVDDNNNSGSSNSSIKKICKDPSALNYSDSNFGQHYQSQCIFDTTPVIEDPVETAEVAVPDTAPAEVLDDSAIESDEVLTPVVETDSSDSDDLNQSEIATEPISEEVVGSVEYVDYVQENNETNNIVEELENKKEYKKIVLPTETEPTFFWKYLYEIMIFIGFILFMGYYLLIWKRKKEDKEN